MLASLIAAATLAASCTAGEAPPPQTETGDPGPTPVAVTAAEYSFTAPDTVPAGLIEVSLTNRGTMPHSATLVRLDSGKTLPDWIAAYREANLTRGPRPTWATYHGGAMALGPAAAGKAVMSVEPGNYAWVCFMPDSTGTVDVLAHGHAHPFVVRPAGAAAPASLPAPTASVRLTEYALETDPPWRAGAHVIRIANAGVEPHHVLFFRIAPGRTIDDFSAWVRGGMQGEPPSTLEGAMGEVSGGGEAYLEVDLPPGEYALVCLVAGRDEESHLEKGMVLQLRIE
jgi:hypothetical protein